LLDRAEAVQVEARAAAPESPAPVTLSPVLVD
jgi:hypothetical protein